jgi:hypothetical protein
LEFVVTVVFALDIILTFLTPYADKDGKMIRNYSSIALNYAKMIMPRGLIIDTIATFPF